MKTKDSFGMDEEMNHAHTATANFAANTIDLCVLLVMVISLAIGFLSN